MGQPSDRLSARSSASPILAEDIGCSPRLSFRGKISVRFLPRRFPQAPKLAQADARQLRLPRLIPFARCYRNCCGRRADARSNDGKKMHRVACSCSRIGTLIYHSSIPECQREIRRRTTKSPQRPRGVVKSRGCGRQFTLNPSKRPAVSQEKSSAGPSLPEHCRGHQSPA